jgi:ABC-type hemin transport system substrate-binding protein
MVTPRIDRRHAMLTAAVTLAACKTPRAARPAGAAQRVVSVAPNTTETLFALGLGSRVVGVSSFCDFPLEATRRPRVGALSSLSLEAIVALRPDALVGAPGVPPSILARLADLGVRVLIEPVESIRAARALAITLANLCGESLAGTRWAARFDQAVAEASARGPLSPMPRVLAVVDQRPIVCAGPGSYVDELLRAAGAVNALASGPAWPQLSLEAVLRAAPDVVLDLCGPVAQEPLARAWSAHSAIPAVRDRRVFAVPDPLVTRPGPRAPRAIALVADALRSAAG